ncbi:hypothetical protein DPMN_189356 [Dreissena polymorpha]|uniref:SRCR domain-containing protein n=1 Tax=Dreissena polymorpha TaxID=45954 RepID=A0A9D4IAR4_DREPO|nr:hypothetical protein DPMN_189356 [Dreissena polymorpha]
MDSAARLLCATLCAIVTYSPDQVFGQITPPPEGLVPVEANGLLYNLYYVPTHCKDPFVNVPKDVAGGLLVQNRERKVLMAKYNPYMIRGNIEIEPQGCLVIMPGVKMYFDPGFGIIVNGTLIARGSYIPNGRILMTKNPNASDHLGPNSPWPQDARLVDGNTTRDGRLDLQYNSKWRGVCTNYNNFTNIDLNVTCRHLGFVYGNFTYHSFSRNETDYMLFEKPACRGSENSLFDCPGAKDIKYGPTICDGQQVIGFECAGLRPDLAKDHWRGIEIYNSTVTMVYSTSERLRYNITETYLEYLDIEYAGLDIYKVDGLVHGFASISASPYVPIMNNITVSHGAYDGLNLTDIRGEIHIANSSVSHNRGHGLFIKSPVGQTLINMTDITHNWGDGVKMYVSNYTINEFNRDYPWSDSFCRVASSNQYMFPITLHQDVVSPIGEKPVGSSCQLNIRTAPQKMITLHTLIMERDPQASGMITVRDGGDLPSHPIILQFMVNNGSFPQSVTTKTDTIHIKFDFDIPRPDGEPVKRCKSHRPCIRFLMELTTNYGPDIELRVYNASVSNNTGYGVNIQDVRSKVSINSSVVSDNCYGAGIRVYQGAAEIAINSTIIERNMKCGVNISYSGGYQLINGSTIANNYGYGVITEYLLLNRTRFELDGKQKIEVVKSFFMWNEWTAFRIGNYCRGGEYLVNQSYFAYNLHESIEYLSCNISTSTPTNFSMAFTEFRGNKRHAVLISPIVNTVGTFTNNTFREHTLGVLRIDNGYDFIENRWYRELPVAYKIYENKFTNNTGRYVVNFRLSQPGVKHRLEFKFNTVQGNIIVDPFQYLKPRSKADAVIVVSSGNVEIQRNLIDNPKSIRDIATHLVDPSVLILANYNWWMTFEHSLIYPRLFDRNSRYNLAELKYHPVLKNNWLYGNYDTSLEPEYRWPFARGNYIGGVLDDNFVTNDYTKTYRVDRDIIILKGKTLEILAGTTLEFLPSIGMMILGRLKADGANVKFGPPQEIKFKLYEDDYIPIENRTVYEEIRLVDGANDYEGRLELNLTGEFGTVCSDGWTDQNSALVCQQLGLTFNPLYGRPTQVMFSDPTRPIYLSHVSCDTLDTDVRKCRSMKRGEFSCDHSRDVFIRCQPPTWSGVTIPAQPRHGRTFETQLRYVSIEKAGLLDFIEMSYAPGLRIDYNFYKMSYISVRNCVSDGINIKYANPFSQSLLEKVTVENNLGNGIVTRSPFLEMSHISLVNNAKAGFVYDPMFTEYEALSVRNFISKDETISLTTQTQLQVGPDKMIFLTTDPNPIAEDRTYEVEIITGDPFFRVCIQVFDYNPLTSIEKVTFYSSDRYSWQSAKSWTIEEDLVDFPIVSSQQFMTIRYRVNGTRSGRLAFAVISVGYNQNYDSIIKVYNATIKNNERGIVTKHYNNPSNERMEIFHRAKKETIHFELMTIEGSKQEAMFIPSLTKWHTNFIPTLEEMTRAEKVGEIKYVIVHSKIKNNYKGIHAEHNHVDFANNVWKWNVSYVTIENCETGGFEIELPRVNDLIERQVHQVIVNSSEMMNNKKFSFNILGYYADVRIEANKIHDNNCLLGVMKMSGMEKDLYIYENRIENNINCKFAIDLDLMSHSEYSSSVSGMIMYNYITSTRNTYVPQGLGITSTPVTYAVQVKGVQNVTLVRNVFDNKDLQYELVAGVTALILDNKMNVKENYWGTTDQYQIRKRIFDFDDWNNYAIAEYFPFLGVPNPRGDLAPDSELVIRLDLNRLGGRVIEDLTLPYRSEPYIVYSDLTIMPDAKFSIPAGVHLKFYPNVGILVLGQLVATGAPYSRIKFSPAEPDLPFGRRKRQEPQHPETLTSSDIRFRWRKAQF